MHKGIFFRNILKEIPLFGEPYQIVSKET